MKQIITLFLAALAGQAQPLPITWYDGAGLDRGVADHTIQTLSRIFQQSGLDVQVRSGDPHEQEANLVLYTERRDVCRARRDIALRLRASAPDGMRGAVLAYSHPFAPGGVNVTVFLDRVEAAALQQRRPMSLLLAHVIAHEIGHVLLRSTEHSKGGLMSSHWNEHEFSLMPIGALLFSREQSRQIRRSLTGEGCRDAKNR